LLILIYPSSFWSSGVERIIAIADKGLNNGDSIAFNFALEDCYIYVKSVRGANAEFKEWKRVLGKVGRGFKIKSKVVRDALISITVEQARKKKRKQKVKIEQKWIVFFGEKYAVKAKHKRDDAIEKAMKMVADPAKYRRSFDYGAAGHIENLVIDKETGEILNIEDVLRLDV